MPAAALPFFNVRDYGAKGDGTTNDTVAVTAAIAAASVAGGCVVFAPGDYRIDNIIVPDYVILLGLAGGFSRFGPTLTGGRRAAVRLLRYTITDTNPLVTLAGAGSGVKNLTMEGYGAPGTILVAGGFETAIEDIRCISSTGIGIDVQKANNTRWRSIYVDNCGWSTLPAVKIWSAAGVGLANETNTCDIVGLDIERSANTALEVAVGTSSATNWVEWLRHVHLHVESSYLDTPNLDPLIKIGNIRSVTFVDPFIYGGPGYLIEHNQQATRAFGNGGLRIIGGTLLGSDVASGATVTPTLVHLIAGDDVTFQGTRFFRYGTSVVTVESAYGTSVKLDSSCYFGGPGTTVLGDLRSALTPLILRGNAILGGHLESSSTAPAIANGSGITGSSLLSGSTDASGTVFFGSTSSPVAGILATLTFAKAYTRQPAVILFPGTAAAAALGLYVAVSTTGFTIRATNAPAASQANTAYQVQYVVIG